MESLEDMARIAQICSPLIFLSSTIIAALAIFYNVRINKRNKRADVIMHCNNRYDELYKYRIELRDSDDIIKTKAYYARYWGLKGDQFDYWLSGLVDIETFTSWFYSTLESFRANGQVGALTFIEGWEAVGLEDHRSINPWFNKFIGDIISLKNGTPSTLHDLLKCIEQLEARSAPWRKKIKGDMSLKFYRTSLNDR